MQKNKPIRLLCSLLALCAATINVYAQPYDDENSPFGQTVQINTRLNSWVGRPSLLLIIRDVDNGINIPYLFEINRGSNAWVAFSYGKNYIITASILTIETFRPRYDQFKTYKIRNFCHLESQGRILHGESMTISIDGDLTPDTNTYSCHLLRFPETHFPIVNQDTNDNS